MPSDRRPQEPTQSLSHRPKLSEQPQPSRNASPLPSRPYTSKYSESEIRKRLALLSNLARPLSPTLPLSPPASPKPAKRKLPHSDSKSSSSDDGSRIDSVKRPRIGAQPSNEHNQLQPSALPPFDSTSSSTQTTLRSNTTTDDSKKEEGEVDETPLPNISASHPSPPETPLVPRRPRTLTKEQFTSMYERYGEQARTLKRSADKRGDARGDFMSRKNVLALLEHTDAILFFIYSFWCSDESHGVTQPQYWNSLLSPASLIEQTGRRWDKMYHEATTEENRAIARVFVGLISLVKFVTMSRITRLKARQIKSDTQRITTSSRIGSSASPPNATTLSTHPTPPPTLNHPLPPPPHKVQAPSPASSAAPARTNSQSPIDASSPSQVLVAHSLIDSVQKTFAFQNDMMVLQQRATRYLTMHNLRRLFARTYGICAGDNYTTGHPLIAGEPNDRQQVDIEACGQGNGEWAWPVISGDDIPHVAGFGRSLVREAGFKLGGYRGLEGAWKTDDGEPFS